MAKIPKLGFTIALGLGLAISASGQGRGFSAPARSFSVPARSASLPMRASAGRSFSGVRRGFSTRGRPGRGVFAPGTFGPGRCGAFTRGVCGPAFFPPPVTATPLEPNFGLVNGVPGLGFDFPHLAAINRGFNNQFGFFNALNSGFFNNGVGVIPFFSSLPLYYPSYEEETPDYYSQGAQQPQFAVPSPQQSMTLPPAEIAPRAATPQAPPEPPPELGQLILVRKDGQVLMAVAFTTAHGQLTYITREGLRRSFAVTELDKDATRQMNDANGTSVSLPE